MQAERMQKNCLAAPDTACGAQSTHSVTVCWVKLVRDVLAHHRATRDLPHGGRHGACATGGVFSRFSTFFLLREKKKVNREMELRLGIINVVIKKMHEAMELQWKWKVDVTLPLAKLFYGVEPKALVKKVNRG